MTVYFAKTFHRVFTAVDHVRTTSQLLYDNKIFCTMLFSIDVHWNAPLWNWRNCLLDVYMLLENCFTLTCRSNDFLVTFWKLICNHTVTPCWLWMMLKNSPNQGGANSVTLTPWHTKSRPRMLVALKAAFLENYFVDSPWILNGYSI